MDIQGGSTMVGWDFSPDGRYFTVSQRNGTVLVWDVDRREPLFTWQAWPSTAEMLISRQVAFTFGGQQLVVVDESGTALRLLNLVQLNQELYDISLGW